MSEKSKELVDRFRAFNEEVSAFVGNCSDEDWKKICAWEEWPVGVAARHIAAGHYSGFIALAKLIVAGDKMPGLTPEDVVKRANDHAREHSGCTREEVLGLTRESGRALIDYVTGLSDAELTRTASMPLMGGDINTLQLLEMMVLLSAGKHFANIKDAVRA